jgi:mannitol-1-phosphate 5-dehydrogenase
MPLIAAGIETRIAKSPEGRFSYLDIIIAENARDAKKTFLDGIRTSLSDKKFPLEDYLGLIETSIGKMVPLSREEDLAEDPLRLFAEEYETLILDNEAFHSEPPPVPGLMPVEHIQAWVDRKLFVHNLGHAASAYLGYKADKTVTTIAEALNLPGVKDGVRSAMNACADALVLEYGKSFSREELKEHIEELIHRFGNSALGDTVYRVGRDLRRKLSEDDRIVGAMLFCAKRGIDFTSIAGVYRAALEWKACGNDGKLFPADREFHETLAAGRPVKELLESLEFMKDISGLDNSTPEKKKVLEVLKKS